MVMFGLEQFQNCVNGIDGDVRILSPLPSKGSAVDRVRHHLRAVDINDCEDSTLHKLEPLGRSLPAYRDSALVIRGSPGRWWSSDWKHGPCRCSSPRYGARTRASSGLPLIAGRARLWGFAKLEVVGIA